MTKGPLRPDVNPLKVISLRIPTHLKKTLKMNLNLTESYGEPLNKYQHHGSKAHSFVARSLIEIGIYFGV